MTSKPKKTQAQKDLIKFRNQLYNLLSKYPNIRIAGDINGAAIAWIFTEGEKSFEEIALPCKGKQ